MFPANPKTSSIATPEQLKQGTTPKVPAAAVAPVPVVPTMDPATKSYLQNQGAKFAANGQYQMNGKLYDLTGKVVTPPALGDATKTQLTNMGATFNADGSYTWSGKSYNADGSVDTSVKNPTVTDTSDFTSGAFGAYGQDLTSEEQATENVDAATIGSTQGATPQYDEQGEITSYTYSPTPEEIAEHKQNLSNAGQTAQRGYGDVGAAAKTAELQSQKAGELLGLGPAAIKYKIDQYQDQTNQLFKSIADAYSQIGEDYNSAVTNEDYAYAQQLQAEKMNLLAVQRQAIQDRATFTTNAFNAYLGFKTSQVQGQSNAINQVQNAYSLNQIPSQAQWDAAGFTGTPPRALNLAVWSAPFVSDGKMMQENKQTGEMKVLSVSYFQTLGPADQEATIESWTNDVIDIPGDISKITDPQLRDEVQMRVQGQLHPTSTAANAASSPSLFPGSGAITDTVGNIWNHFFNNQNSTSTAPQTGGVSTDTQAIQDLGNQLNSISVPTQ